MVIKIELPRIRNIKSLTRLFSAFLATLVISSASSIGPKLGELFFEGVIKTLWAIERITSPVPVPRSSSFDERWLPVLPLLRERDG
jgi:hypothetical protein